MKNLHALAFILVIIGGLNWGLTTFELNVISLLLGSYPIAETIVYVLVGLSAVYLIFTHKRDCKTCSAKNHPAM